MHQCSVQILLPVLEFCHSVSSKYICLCDTARPQVARFFVPEKNPCISKTVHYEVGKNPKNPRKTLENFEICRFLQKIHVSTRSRLKIQISLDPIENRVSARPALLEATYLEALLYIHLLLKKIKKTKIILLFFSFSGKISLSYKKLI